MTPFAGAQMTHVLEYNPMKAVARIILLSLLATLLAASALS